MDIIQQETGIVFMKVLECAGVYKCDEKGRTDFKRFLDIL
jgi:UDPglucose--hexose-1-phosphate uridylyltransferase